LRALLIILVALFTIAPGIVQLPPVDRDEARYVQATKQMVETGDYVDIRFQDESRYKKPVGIYWLQSAAVFLSGEGAAAPIWVYRTISVLGIVLAALAVLWTGARLFGREAGLVAALMLVAIFGAAFEGRIGKTDAMLLACVLWAQGALAQVYVASRRGEAVASRLWLVFWVAQGAAILIKGPVGPLISALPIVVLSIADRNWRWLGGLRTLPGVAIAAVIVLPWLVLITLKSGGAFWAESVGKDLAGKITQGAESHGAPPGYYVLTYSLFFWPFGLVAMGAGLAALRAWRDEPAVRFCIAWYIPVWLFFEAIGTKLPHYMLPAYPALMLLAGWAVTKGPVLLPERWGAKGLWWATAFGLAVVTAALAGIAIGAPIYLEGAFSWWSIPAAVFALGAGIAAFSKPGSLSLRRIALAAGFAGAAYAVFFTVLGPSLSTIWLSPRIAAAVAEHRPCPDSRLASAAFYEPSLIFLVGTDTLLTDTAGAAQALVADPACALALVPSGETAMLDAALSAAGLRPSALATIDGVNYSSGDHLSLILYRAGK